MKEAIVQPDLTVKIVDSQLPMPNDDQILIKVMVSGSNPKDWKVPHWSKKPSNSGDDIAGIVQAASIPLAAMTSAIGLYQHLEGLPLPWHPTTKPIPLIIYGAASAVGAYAVKLARLSNIHPLICVAGKGIPFVQSLIDISKGDVVLDYRNGDAELIQSLKSAVDKAGGKVEYAFDAVSEAPSFVNVCQVLDHETGQISLVTPKNDYSAIPSSIRQSQTMVGAVHASGDDQHFQKETGGHAGNMDFGYMFFRFFSRGLQEGWFKGHPHEVMPGGLGGIEAGMKNLKNGKASAIKYVFRLRDSVCLERPKATSRKDSWSVFLD
ncbi:MAG: hypothetical protein Q9228_004365 [Teloschistes exilis]